MPPESVLHRKTLATLSLQPAPELANVKPYPRPAPKPEAKTAGAVEKAKESIDFLRDQLAEGHKLGLSAVWQKALTVELEAAKRALAKAGENKPACKTASMEFLQARVDGAAVAHAGATDKHAAHLKALDAEVLRLQEIRAHKVADFAEAQEAYATRLAEDKKALQEMHASIQKSVGADAVMEPSTDAADKILLDLQRESIGAVPADFPPCPDTGEAGVVDQLSALWGFYASCSFWAVPAVTFEQLGIQPGFAHKLLADKVWVGFWGDMQANITATHHVPTAMHTMLKHIVSEKAKELEGLSAAAATARYEKAKEASAARRAISGTSPY